MNNIDKITPDCFERSLYYIGPGYDIEPLLRFTHLTDTFIYVNLHLKFGEISHWYDEQFEMHPDIEVVEKDIDNTFDETTHYELHPDYITHLTQPSFITKKESEDYYHAFNHAKDDPQWAIRYRLKRKSLDREITLYYLTAEGLASYIALSHNGKYAPRVLTTIQTGVLEESEGLMNSLFDNNAVKKPEIWVRGFMPEPPVTSFFGIERQRTEKYVLNSTGVFPVVGMSFNHRWVCGEFDQFDPTNERHCKGFITQDRKQELSKLIVSNRFASDSHRFDFGNIVSRTADIPSNDIVVAPRSIHENLKVDDSQVIDWENIIEKSYHYGKERYVFLSADEPYKRKLFIPVSEQLELLHRQLKKHGIQDGATIHIIPYCMEDEGKPYAETLSNWDTETITYINNLCDFVDLKE